MTGKEVVEVYYSAPDAELEKPFQELAGFQKVSVAPGRTGTVTITFDTASMASYDEAREAYILEGGTYTIRVGNSSRNTAAAATITLDESAVVEYAANQLGLTKAEMKAGSYDGDAGYVLNNAYEINERNQRAATPQYGAKAFDMIDRDTAGYGTGITPSSEGLTAQAKNLSLRAASFIPVEHTYTEGVITTYVSSDSGTDSARYAAGKSDSESEKLETVEAAENATLIDVINGSISVEQLVASMSSVELADLVEGGTFDGLSADPTQEAVVGSQATSVYGAAGETTSNLYTTRYIPNTVMSDGPAGIRITNEYQLYTPVPQTAVYDPDETYYTASYSWSGTTYTETTFENADAFRAAVEGGSNLFTTDGTMLYQYCTAFPIGTLLAQTWDPEVIEEVGRAIGVEMLEYGVTSFLAPGMNIHRNPLCGRNFEYYSEDPLIAGMTAAAETLGVEINEDGSRSGVGVTLKHFAFNDQEASRMGSNSVVSERAAREIYLKGFEIAVKNAQADYIMSSYNMVNGTPTFENYGLLTEILRNEWGFEGYVMTDWYSVGGVRGKNVGKCVLLNYAGNDLEMPGNNVPNVLAALSDGTIMRLGDLQRSAINMINIIQYTPAFEETLDRVIENSADADTVTAARAAKTALARMKADGSVTPPVRPVNPDTPTVTPSAAPTTAPTPGTNAPTSGLLCGNVGVRFLRLPRSVDTAALPGRSSRGNMVWTSVHPRLLRGQPDGGEAVR